MTEIATVDWFGRWGTSVFSICYSYTIFMSLGEGQHDIHFMGQ